MNEKSTVEAPLTTGDWIMAVLCFGLPVLLPIVLSICNFARGRKSRGILYVGTLFAQLVIGSALGLFQ